MSIEIIKDYIHVDNKEWRNNNPAATQHFIESEKEANKFKKNKEGLISDKNLVEIREACPVCKSNKFFTLFLKWGFEHCKCEDCKSIFVRNVLIDDLLIKLYQNSIVDQLAFERTLDSKSISYHEKIYIKYISYFNKYFKNKNKHSILDLGCGSGLFIKTLIRKFPNLYEVFGLEHLPSSKKELVPLIGDKFFYQKSLTELEEENYRFDIITLWGVLEHLKSPREMVQQLSKLINLNGLTLFLLPNPNSRAFKLLGVNTPTFNPREHLQFFDRMALVNLMQSTGFEPIIFGQELPVIDLMWEYLPENFNEFDQIIERDESYYQIYVFKKIF